ncbi:MAG TPA: c-type cytochrome [Candidatus Angelobacter sp.]|nr:c-type cytochrome [Candidatus Angelobacter sp.]
MGTPVRPFSIRSVAGGAWVICGAALFALFAAAQAPDTERLNTMIEALNRLSPEQVTANPKLKAALDNVLGATRGTPQFVELVKKFDVRDQAPALIETAVRTTNSTTAAEAMRLVLQDGGGELVRKALDDENVTNATRIVAALGSTGGKEIVPLLKPVVADSKREVSVRKQAVHALAQTQEGAVALLQLARDQELPDDVKFAASSDLNGARWPAIKAEAARLLPLPQGKDAQPLAPISELVKISGDAKRGAEVFRRDAVGCVKCHQVNGEGVDFGPNLSEIGTKLGKEALYESILDPSAGISFGYEAWQIELKNGDEAYGLIVSETADELAVKAVGAVVTRYRKSDITKREQQRLSIMPAGLQQTMSAQDLVDLVDYLSALKKAAK